MQTKASKSMKVYGSVLGLAAAAFAVDRWVIGQPDAGQADGQEYVVARPSGATAPAPAAAARAQPGAVVAKAQKAVPARPAPAEPLAARLAAAVEARSTTENAVATRDAFRPSDAWIDRKPAALPAEPAPAPPPDPVAEFRARHKLNAVMRTAGGGVAIIDGKTLRPGAKLDGFRLVRVGLRSAWLESDDGAGRKFDMALDALGDDGRATASTN